MNYRKDHFGKPVGPAPYFETAPHLKILHIMGRCIAVVGAPLKSKIITSAKENGFQSLIHFGRRDAHLLQTAEKMGIEAFGGNLGGTELPTSGDDQIEWQETLINHSNYFAPSADPDKKLLIITDKDRWSKIQAGLSALVCLQFLGCSPEDAHAFLVKLNPDVAALIGKSESDVARRVFARTYLGD